jgi:uncharacterized membrane protein
MYRNQKATFGNGRSHLHRHMKATGYAGWLAENWWRMPGGVCVAKRYWIEKKKKYIKMKFDPEQRMVT